MQPTLSQLGVQKWSFIFLCFAFTHCNFVSTFSVVSEKSQLKQHGILTPVQVAGNLETSEQWRGRTARCTRCRTDRKSINFLIKRDVIAQLLQ